MLSRFLNRKYKPLPHIQNPAKSTFKAQGSFSQAPPPTPTLQAQAQAPMGSTAGALILQAFTAQRALPVKDATVTVRNNSQDQSKLLYSVRTDSSGQSITMLLDGIAKDLTLSPENSYSVANANQMYDITVSHPDFATVHLRNVPIYQGITSVQLVDMLPSVLAPQAIIIQQGTPPLT